MRYDLWSGDREKATALSNGLKVLMEETRVKIVKEGSIPDMTSRTILKMWNPKATKPFAHYIFKTKEEAIAYAEKQAQNYDSYKESVNVRKAARAGTTDQLAQVKVGDIFVATWGYDQTNVDFYQVTERRGKMAFLKEIGDRATGESTGNSMADYCTAVKDSFSDRPGKWHKIQFSSGKPYFTVRSFAWATPWDGRPEYRSWYA